MGRKRSRQQPTPGARPACIDHYTNSSLSPEILSSPHIEQCRGAYVQRRPAGEVPRVLLHGAAPRLPYRRREAEPKSAVHWGQRKLLLSEIEFLSEFGRPVVGGVCCIYIGAAPGRHIPFLSQLFPEIEFVLIDPSSFCIGDTNKISIRNEFATPTLCATFSGRTETVLCISDLRTADWRLMDAAAVECAVRQDMELQRDCVRAIGPAAALVKFRLPYSGEGTEEYLDGEIRLPIWGPQTTTESRLLVRRAESGGYNTKAWDVKAYNQEMFYFNTITRVNTYNHTVKSAGLDYCYDCAAEVAVLQQYALNGPQAGDIVLHPNKLRIIVGKLVRKISLACSLSGKRDLENWKSGNQFELKVYDQSTGSLVVVGDEAEAGEVGPLSAEGVCMSAWRSASAAGTPSWVAVEEDSLVTGDRNVGWTYVYGSNGFGLDIPLESPVTYWVWAVLHELLYSPACKASVLDTREASALASWRYSATPTARHAVCAALGLHQFTAPPELTMCAQCLRTCGDCVGVSRARGVFLFCRTGNVYIVWVDVPGSCITKVVLPTCTRQHASDLTGTIHIHYYSKNDDASPPGGNCGHNTGHPSYFECCRQVMFDQVHSIDGKLVSSGTVAVLRDFMRAELSSDRTTVSVLLQAGFHGVSADASGCHVV